MIWGLEKIQNYIVSTVSKKLEQVPLDQIQTPDLSIAGPAIESLRYTGHKESLSELYSNLLASSMDSETAKNAHPGFVEIIRNLSSDEAKVISLLYEKNVFPIIDIRQELKDDIIGHTAYELISPICHDAGCEHQDLVSIYPVNLERLGLLRLDKGSKLTADKIYDRILLDPTIKAIIDRIDITKENKAKVIQYFAEITPLGQQFGKACVVDKSII